MKYFLLIFLFCLFACKNQQSAQEAVLYVPKEVDKPFANVFQALDGTWQGTFYVYSDTLGQQDQKRLYTLSDSLFATLPLKIDLTILVTQHYTSESPYLQTVKITDRYTDGQVVESEGINKVENGKLWCVVDKPDEQVVHTGSLPDSHTIIWQREERSPLKIEYFQETVLDSTYTILGWGYYGADNPKLSPKTWFRGVYRR